MSRFPKTQRAFQSTKAVTGTLSPSRPIITNRSVKTTGEITPYNAARTPRMMRKEDFSNSLAWTSPGGFYKKRLHIPEGRNFSNTPNKTFMHFTTEEEWKENSTALALKSDIEALHTAITNMRQDLKNKEDMIAKQGGKVKELVNAIGKLTEENVELKKELNVIEDERATLEFQKNMENARILEILKDETNGLLLKSKEMLERSESDGTEGQSERKP